MNTIRIPADYRPLLNAYETQRAIACVKTDFSQSLAAALNLKRVSAPLFVLGSSGLNDDLSGKEEPVTFTVPALGTSAQVVHSLAKWKRLALKEYQFAPGEGLYTDMNAIRREETLDNTHSIYVDQWDWERIISREERNLSFLMDLVKTIWAVTEQVSRRLRERFPQLPALPGDGVSFITSQELEDLYPDLPSGEAREQRYVREHPVTCVLQIGGNLRSGTPHGLRAPDYDDWELNCDLIVWHEVLDQALELSSMGIRVDEQSLARQLAVAGCEDRRELPFHRMLLNGELPLTVGGGIGQSRLCMLLMGCAHIGEVQSSIWDEETRTRCRAAGIRLL